VVRVATVGTSLRGTLRLREWETGGGDECGEEGVSSSPFYKGRGGVEASEWGGDRPTAVVMAIQFSGEGKWRG
jgi:hypothetical protein